jgi:hypothetical protein
MSWTAGYDPGIPTYFYTLAVSGSNLYAGTGAGVFVSDDYGMHWEYLDGGMSPRDVTSFVFMDGDIFVGSLFGVYRLPAGSSEWTYTYSGTQMRIVNALATSGDTLFAGTDGDGVYYSTDLGDSWESLNSGLEDKLILSLAVAHGSLYAGTLGGVWKLPLSEIITSAEESDISSEEDQLQFNISPNPFQASTMISFTLPVHISVTLDIFNTTGTRVTGLIDGDLNHGSHNVKWNAEGMPAGVYVCRLKAGGRTYVRQVVLVR